MSEQLAVIKGIHFGNRDTDQPCLWFSTHISECEAALQVLVGKDALAAIKASGVYDIKELEGKSCWVEASGGRIRFLRFWGSP